MTFISVVHDNVFLGLYIKLHYGPDLILLMPKWPTYMPL